MVFEITPIKVALHFAGIISMLIVIGIIIGLIQVPPARNDASDCVVCNQHFDAQIPLIESTLALLSQIELPLFGLCKSCRFSLQGSHVERSGNFCISWKKDETAINTFNLYIPHFTISCACHELFAAAYSLDTNAPINIPLTIVERFPCLNILPSAVKMLETSSDDTLTSLRICHSMAKSYNQSKPVKKVRAKIMFSVTDFQIRFTATINKTLDLQKLVVRLSHIGPENLKIECIGHPYYRQMCHCLETSKIQFALYHFLKVMFPCFLNYEEGKSNAINLLSSHTFLNDFAFCFPDLTPNYYKKDKYEKLYYTE